MTTRKTQLYRPPSLPTVRSPWVPLITISLLLAGCANPVTQDDPDEPGMILSWRWSQGPAPQVERGEAGCASDHHAEILVAGGLVDPPMGLPVGFDVTRRVEVYDAIQDNWYDAPDLPVPVHHPAVAYAAERWWVTGGYPGPTFVPSDLMLSWAPGEGSWAIHERMPVARGAHGAAAIGDTLILVGGVTTNGVTARVDAYNTSTGDWKRLRDAPVAREHVAVDAIDDRVYVAGGRDGGLDAHVDGLDIYNYTTGEWEQAEPIPTPRGGSAGVGTPYGFIVVGGEESGGTFSEVERYDPENREWEALQDDPDPRHGLCAAWLEDRLHVITGGHEPGFAVSTTHNVLIAEETPAS